jgi:octaprenyl-diphosphate synthase
VLANAPIAQQVALARYGKHLGIAYQLVDDALDYKSDPATRGKNLGDDLAEGKPTLPLLHALRHGNDEQRALIRLAIEQGGLAQLGPIVEAIETTGGLDYAAAFAQRETAQALAALDELPETTFRQALAALARFAQERTS